MKMPPDHKMTFKDALHTVASNVFLNLLIPNWALGLTQDFRKIRLAFEELQVRSIFAGIPS
jgi:hypothetical protein